MKSLIKFLSIKLIAIFFVFNVNAQEFNDLETYSGSIAGAYNIANLPLLPGNWKVDDQKKGEGNKRLKKAMYQREKSKMVLQTKKKRKYSCQYLTHHQLPVQ